MHAAEYGASAIGLMVRRTRVELDETFERARDIYGKISARATYNPRRFTFPNGARITYAYLERDSDAEIYQGASYTRIYVEEAGNFPSPAPIMKLMATLRSGVGVPVGMRLTGNPGGPGHQWLRSRYIDPAPLGWKVLKDDGGLERIYIPSRVADNKYLGADYVQRLKASGSPELVRAWLEGDWSVVSGAFFPEFSLDRHVIPPRELPEHWPRFRSFDWGSARPFSCGWWAVSDGSLPDIARGAIVRYREWYGMRHGEPNVGLKLTAEAVADGIKLREEDDPAPLTGVADPAMFAEDGGPSIAMRMIGRGVVFRPADNKRVPQRGAMGGWDQVRSRLVGDADERPMLLMFSTCRDLIRTLPALQHDDARPEDIDCWVAGTMVATPSGAKPIETIATGDLVDTPIGPRAVLRSYLSGASETVKITLADGRSLEGTPHHKVYVRGKGLVPLADLECYDVLIERNTWQSGLSTTVLSIRATRAVFTIIRTGLRSVAARLASIGRFGSMPAIAFQTVGTSTTGTATTTTTTSATWNASRPRSTIACTPRSALLETLGSGWRSGAHLLRASGRFAPMPSRCERTRQSVHARADIVGVLLRLDILSSASALLPVRRLCRILRASFAAPSSTASRITPSACGPVRIVAVGRSAVRTPVYNLTVDDAHLFYANGILSSNTDMEDHAADECRYACMSRPFVRDAAKPAVRDTWDAAFRRARESQDAQAWKVV